MNIYLLSQTEYRGYDTYDSAVVFADSEDAARMMHPREPDAMWSAHRKCWHTPKRWAGDEGMGLYGEWPDPLYVKVTLLGVANPDANPDPKPGVVCASFNAG